MTNLDSNSRFLSRPHSSLPRLERNVLFGRERSRQSSLVSSGVIYGPSFLGDSTAWWGDESRAVLIECRRQMNHQSGNRYSPSGKWNVTGVIHRLHDVGGPEKTKWKFNGSASEGDDSSPPVVTHDPLDLLPPDVVAPIRGGLSDIWMLVTSSNATEYLTAIRVVDDEVLLLDIEANRTSRSEASLHRSEWKLATLASRVIKVRRSHLFVESGRQ